jgi:hypothetical protein
VPCAEEARPESLPADDPDGAQAESLAAEPAAPGAAQPEPLGASPPDPGAAQPEPLGASPPDPGAAQPEPLAVDAADDGPADGWAQLSLVGSASRSVAGAVFVRTGSSSAETGATAAEGASFASPGGPLPAAPRALSRGAGDPAHGPARNDPLSPVERVRARRAGRFVPDRPGEIGPSVTPNDVRPDEAWDATSKRGSIEGEGEDAAEGDDAADRDGEDAAEGDDGGTSIAGRDARSWAADTRLPNQVEPVVPGAGSRSGTGNCTGGRR